MVHPLLSSPYTKTLDNLVMWGVAEDLYLALVALNLYDTVADNATDINAGHYGQTFFGSIQDMAFRELSLSLSRMYETPRRNKLRSIPAALDYLTANAQQLSIFNRAAIFRHYSLSDLGLVQHAVPDDAAITTSLATHLRRRVSAFSGIDGLRKIRDNRLAHHDFQKEAKKGALRFTEVDVMIAFGLDFVATLGEGYIGTNCTPSTSPHYVVEGAARPAFSMYRLLELAGMTPKRSWIGHEDDLRRRIQIHLQGNDNGTESPNKADS